jgi:hypothetical protein
LGLPLELRLCIFTMREQLVSSIGSLYRAAYPTHSSLSPGLVLKHWRQTTTRSTRLLVRLTINELDLLAQNGSVR